MNHDVAATGAATPLTGIITALRRLLAAGIAHVAARGELFAIEYAEEKERLFVAAIAVIVGVAGAFFALMLAMIALLLYAWDTAYRWPVAIALPVCFAVLAIGGWWTFRATISRPSALFRTSLMELRRDVESING
jgi:uncharacterized membrane protein YqjE